MFAFRSIGGVTEKWGAPVRPEFHFYDNAVYRSQTGRLPHSDCDSIHHAIKLLGSFTRLVVVLRSRAENAPLTPVLSIGGMTGSIDDAVLIHDFRVFNGCPYLLVVRRTPGIHRAAAVDNPLRSVIRLDKEPRGGIVDVIRFLGLDTRLLGKLAA